MKLFDTTCSDQMIQSLVMIYKKKTIGCGMIANEIMLIILPHFSLKERRRI